MSNKKSKLSILINGIIRENPVLVLVLGTCPTLAVTTSVTAAIGMGIAATIVLICSNMVISALRNIIPDKVRIPCYIVLIAGFVTMVQLFMQAYLYSLYQMLGVYLSLIVVNCIILGRAEMFARNNTVGASFLDLLLLLLLWREFVKFSVRELSAEWLFPLLRTIRSQYSQWRPADSSSSAVLSLL